MSSESGLMNFLNGKAVECLIDSEGDSIFDFESLEDGETYMLGPPRQIQPQPESSRNANFVVTSFDAIDERIVKGKDETGTAQTGWRRERDCYISIPIFLRPHLAELKEHLDRFMSHDRLRHLYISGPPGSGKTTYCLFYLTHYVLTNNDKRGLIVQYRAEAPNEIMILEGRNIRHCSSARDNKLMVDLVRDIILTAGKDSFDFCIFDGVRQAKTICQDIGSAITSNIGSNTKVIKITSLEFDIKGGESTGGIDGIDSFFVVSSWKLEDYENAVKAKLMGLDKLQTILCLDSDFEQENEDMEMEDEDAATEKCRSEEEGDAEEVTMKWLVSLLKRKFFYAGGSARYMFDYTIDDLAISTHNSSSVFDRLCERMKMEDWSSFSQLQISASTNSSVSSGMQRIDGDYIPVSEYFLHRAHAKCKAQLTTSLRAVADKSNNPALKGWAFELEQLDIIEQMIKTGVLVSEDRALVLPITSRETTTYSGSSLGVTKSDAFTIWCSRWNQGCFDVAFYFEQNLITMNFTISESHSLKINSLRNLKDVLESSGKLVHSFTHIGVVEEKATCDNFSFDQAKGTGRCTEKELFSIQTMRSQKLTAKIHSQDKYHSPTYGVALSTVKVFPRKWTSTRKRKKVDYNGQS